MRERSFGKTECFIIRGSTIDIIAQIQAPGCFKREKKPRHLNSSCIIPPTYNWEKGKKQGNRNQSSGLSYFLSLTR